MSNEISEKYYLKMCNEQVSVEIVINGTHPFMSQVLKETLEIAIKNAADKKLVQTKSEIVLLEKKQDEEWEMYNLGSKE
jgi:hypothetical protein